MNKTVVLIAGGLGVLVLAVGGYFFLNQNRASIVPETNVTSPSPAPVSDSVGTPGEYKFEIPKKSAHYESNTPAHGEVLAAAPINVVIDFNFDLGKGSEILVYADNVINPRTGTTAPDEVTTGETIIDPNKLSMRRSISPDAADRRYKVDYKACWPDGSCHDGYFQFAIDRSKAASYADWTGKKEVTVNLKDVAFVPQNIRVSAGTKISWVNDDLEAHYVNSDSHPAHSYYPTQNSKALNKGDRFSLTFDTPGIYPYHCSAHTSMTGSIIVE